MNKYPLSKRLGLDPTHKNDDGEYSVEMCHLERALESAQVVYGHSRADGWAFDQQGILPITTHTARLIAIEEIPRPDDNVLLPKEEYEKLLAEIERLNSTIMKLASNIPK